jgi:hypothetical protein
MSPSSSNPALNLAPFSRWTLRDKAVQRRLALRWSLERPLRVDSDHLTPMTDSRALSRYEL